MANRQWSKDADGKYYCGRPKCRAAYAKAPHVQVTVGDLAMSMHAVYEKYNARFQQIFGVRLKVYWNRVQGFDVTEFHEFVSPGVEKNTYSAISRKFGKGASDFIKDMQKDEIEAIESSGKISYNTRKSVLTQRH